MKKTYWRAWRNYLKTAKGRHDAVDYLRAAAVVLAAAAAAAYLVRQTVGP